MLAISALARRASAGRTGNDHRVIDANAVSRCVGDEGRTIDVGADTTEQRAMLVDDLLNQGSRDYACIGPRHVKDAAAQFFCCLAQSTLGIVANNGSRKMTQM